MWRAPRTAVIIKPSVYQTYFNTTFVKNHLTLFGNLWRLDSLDNELTRELTLVVPRVFKLLENIFLSLNYLYYLHHAMCELLLLQNGEQISLSAPEVTPVPQQRRALLCLQAVLGVGLLGGNQSFFFLLEEYDWRWPSNVLLTGKLSFLL